MGDDLRGRPLFSESRHASPNGGARHAKLYRHMFQTAVRPARTQCGLAWLGYNVVINRKL